jgi:hypothetical protein
MRLSVGDLENLRRWKEREDQDLPALLAQLRRQGPVTRNMEAGKAFAKFFEHAREGERGGAIVDGWEFEFKVDAEFALPAVRELKMEETFATPYGPVTLVGVVDGLDGMTVHDQKLTAYFDAQKHTDSLQWRAYLVMTGAHRFVYDIFVGKYEDRSNYVTVYEYHQVPFYTYPDVRRDVEKAVTELAEIVATHMPEAMAA